jgi:hypothetical protein
MTPQEEIKAGIAKACEVSYELGYLKALTDAVQLLNQSNHTQAALLLVPLHVKKELENA